MAENSNKTVATLDNRPAPRYPEFLASPIFKVVLKVPRAESSTSDIFWPGLFPGKPPSTTESKSDEPDVDEEPVAPPSTSIFSPSNKVIVEGSRDISEQKKPETTTDGDTTDDAYITVTYTIHKSLLESVSREMRSHIRNAMREGLTNTMHLSDVLPDTFARFVEWAYTKDYPYDDETTRLPERDDNIPSILVHARLFVLAERFNIIPLRILARERIEKLLEAIVKIDGWAVEVTVGNLSQAWQYLFDNLPVKIIDLSPLEVADISKPVLPSNKPVASSTANEGDVQLLLRGVIKFSSANVKSMRIYDTFRELVLENTEFALAMVDRMGLPGPMDSSALDERLFAESWRCGRCFYTGLSVGRNYRSRVRCNSCGQNVGPTLAN